MASKTGDLIAKSCRCAWKESPACDFNVISVNLPEVKLACKVLASVDTGGTIKALSSTLVFVGWPSAAMVVIRIRIIKALSSSIALSAQFRATRNRKDIPEATPLLLKCLLLRLLNTLTRKLGVL
eukprot:CAMPEP_0169275842 /NCGR_PEP_ID=MMETSP1016-20121227/52637_1 /TAXON_ID=342587 /ORGANISM="Karlodinium micrum, Strain CCMP2283" /LENGTH=124 /DNA_ID=CAMNT_0009362823 /DNA_START=643 /DNA_END=1017 /DNA_ORIENTATION=+